MLESTRCPALPESCSQLMVKTKAAGLESATQPGSPNGVISGQNVYSNGSNIAHMMPESACGPSYESRGSHSQPPGEFEIPHRHSSSSSNVAAREAALLHQHTWHTAVPTPKVYSVSALCVPQGQPTTLTLHGEGLHHSRTSCCLRFRNTELPVETDFYDVSVQEIDPAAPRMEDPDGDQLPCGPSPQFLPSNRVVLHVPPCHGCGVMVLEVRHDHHTPQTQVVLVVPSQESADEINTLTEHSQIEETSEATIKRFQLDFGKFLHTTHGGGSGCGAVLESLMPITPADGALQPPLDDPRYRTATKECLLAFCVDRGWVHCATMLMADLLPQELRGLNLDSTLVTADGAKQPLLSPGTIMDGTWSTLPGQTGSTRLCAVLVDALVHSTALQDINLLHRAVRSGCWQLVWLMIQVCQAAGCPPRWDMPGPRCITPLHMAAQLDDNGAVAAAILAASPPARHLWFTCKSEEGATPATVAKLSTTGPLLAAYMHVLSVDQHTDADLLPHVASAAHLATRLQCRPYLAAPGPAAQQALGQRKAQAGGVEAAALPGGAAGSTTVAVTPSLQQQGSAVMLSQQQQQQQDILPPWMNLGGQLLPGWEGYKWWAQAALLVLLLPCLILLTTPSSSEGVDADAALIHSVTICVLLFLNSLWM